MFNFQNFRSVLKFFSILTVFLSISLSGGQIPNKQQMWDKMAAEVDLWVDGIGYPIDKEIKETVIALNLLGIETRQSCEGHLDHGSLYPWVDIQIKSPQVKKMMEEFSIILEQEDKEEKLLQTKFPNLSYNNLLHIPEGKKLKKLNKKRLSIWESLNEARVKCVEPLNKLLIEFYQNRKTSYDNTLFVTADGLYRLHSIGGNSQQIRSQKDRSVYLKEYQEEMKAFTVFLKQKFMSSN